MITLKDISFKYKNAVNDTLKNISFNLNAGEVLAIVGPSGGGKSTLLRVISGLEDPSKGSIHIDEKEMTIKKPEERGLGMLFQDYALFPHMTVAKNIEYGVDHLPKKERKVVIREMLELVNMIGYEKRYPHELSGGQQQRVALARALAPKPKVLLLDEPFSNLDTELLAKVRDEMFDIIKKINTTTIMVTHNPEDAELYANQIIRIEDGNMS